MVRYNHDQEPRILTESWQSFYQQQQQEGENPPADPPADPPEVVDPFKDIDTSVLDEKQTAAIEAAKVQFATLQKESAATRQALDKTKKVASTYQSEADRAKAELKKLQPPQQQQVAPEYQAAIDLLHESGVRDSAEVEKQAPFFAKMIQKSVALAKQQIGHDLGPMAGSVLNQSATMEFTNARSMSQVMQDPEVAQEVWDKFVLPSIQNGTPVNAEAMNDYAKIVWFDKGKFNQQQQQPPPQQQQQQQMRQPNSGTFTFPGAGPVLPPGNWQPTGQQQQQTNVTPEVNGAVTAVMARLTSGTKIWPKGLSKPPGRQ